MPEKIEFPSVEEAGELRPALRALGDWDAVFRYHEQSSYYESKAYEDHCYGTFGHSERPYPRRVGSVADANDAISNREPGQYSARCPGHEDSQASLRIRVLEGGKVLMKCWAGCETGDVLEA